MFKHPILSTLLNIFSILRFTCIFPHKIQFDNHSQIYFRTRSSFARKVLCMIWQGGLLGYVWWATCSEIFMRDNENSNIIQRTIVRTAYSGYVMYHVIMTNLVWNNCERVVGLLNACKELWTKLDINDNINRVKYFIWTIIFIISLSTVAFTFAILYAGTQNWTHTKRDVVDSSMVPAMVEKTVDSFCDFYYEILCSKLGHSRTESTSESNQLPIKTYGLFSILTVFGLTVELTWVYFHLMIAIWGLYFKYSAHFFLQKIKRGGLMNLQKAIGIFNEISLLIREWNNVFGSLLFAIVVSSCLYKTISFTSILRGNNYGLAMNILSFMNFVPAIILIFVCAEVHRLISTFPQVIKEIFILNDDSQLYQLENLHGMQMVMYDILSRSTALKGLDYFVITYPFIAQMLGAILTYGIVTSQLY